LIRISKFGLPTHIKPIEKQLAQVREWGFDGIEFLIGDIHPLDYESKAARKKLKETIDASGVGKVIYSPGVDFGDPDAMVRRRTVQWYKEYIDLAVDLDINLVRYEDSGRAISVRTEERAPYTQRLGWCMEGVKAVLKHAEDVGVTLASDNHHFTIEENVKLIEELGSDNLRMNVDTGNAYVNFDDYVEGVRKWTKYVAHCHIKDCKVLPTRGRTVQSLTEPRSGGVWFIASVKPIRWVPVGEGDLDIKGFIEALKKEGYNGFVSLEEFAPMPWFETSLKRGLAYLKKLI